MKRFFVWLLIATTSTLEALERLTNRVFGHKCPYCEERTLRPGDDRLYTRGWNKLCNQAAGDLGYWCTSCCHIAWQKSHDEWTATLPDWISPYTPQRNNRSVGRL